MVDGHEVVCWGFNDYGQLGYGDTELRGDDELLQRRPMAVLVGRA